MPSASTNSNNKSKLMKQASFGCSSGGGGSGPGGSTSTTNTALPTITTPGGGSNTTTKAGIPPAAAAAAVVANVPSNASIASNAATETTNNNNSNNSGGSGSINTESVSSNNTLSSSTGKGEKGEKSLAAAAAAAVGGGTNLASNAINEPSSAGNPMRQALITIEHKIRNLEKRKTKLESYRLIQTNGKELSSDQKAAVAKYDAVMATLDFARDLSKQMVQFSKDAEKEQKKQARKDMVAKAQAETAKIREVLVIQNILSCFSDDSVRSDFLNGENGAIKLESTDLDALEQFCFDIQTRRPESVDDPTFIKVAQKVAELFSMTIDGRPKQYGETTFENLRRVFNQIQECGYLDKIYLTLSDSSNAECNEEELPGSADAVAVEDVSSRISNLEENMEKLNINESGIGSNARNTPITNFADAPDVLTEQPLNKEQLDQLQKPSVINAMSMSSTSSVPTSTPMVGITNFAAQMAPPPNLQRSGTTTPVHVAAAMYAPQTGGPPQPVPPQMQQVVPPVAAAMISGLPPPQQPTQVAMPPQHRGNASGVGVQLPPGVSPTMAPSIVAGPPPPGAPYPLTTVHAVEQDFFKQHQQQQQQKFVQQMRPLAEVIGAGSFYFLQDSELDSPEIIGGGNNNSSGGAGMVFESPAPNLLVHVSDVPLTGAAVDLQQQQQSKKLATQQQAAQQQPPQQQLDAQHHTLHQQHPHQQQQIQQQQPPQTQPITTQTFTNQTFPPIQPQPPTQLQRHETTPTSTATAVTTGGGPIPGVSKTPTMNSGSNGNTPTAQLFQQPPNQPGPQSKAALYSPDLVMAKKGVVQPQQLHQQQQQPIMIMTRLATPQARLPMQTAGNVPPQQQPQPTHSGFPFDPMVASFSSYEHVQQQLAAVTTSAQKLASSGGIPNVDDTNRKMSGTTDPAETAVVSDWEATIKGHASRSAVVNSNAAKAAALTSALQQHSSGTSVGGNSSPLESGTNKWSAEMNALSGRGNTPPTTVSHHNNNQSRKNEWSTSGGNGSGSVGGGTSYGSDVVVPTHTETASNHWNANQTPQQQQHDSNTGNSYGRSGGGGGGGGGGGRNSNNAYQRRNDDRRGERSTGGGGGGNNSYRSRTNNNYGGGGGGAQSQQQSNNSGRGGMYFRNNENSQTGTANSFYQNGGLYAKDGGNASRYDNGGNNSYRGPRGGGGGGNNQRNQGPPRTIGRNTSSSGSNTSTGGGGGGNGGNSGGGFIHPRQTNRMSLGLEKN